MKLFQFMTEERELLDQVINDLKTKKIIIALHESLPNGPGHDLRDYLLNNCAKKILFITHPLLNLKEFYANHSCMRTHYNGTTKENIVKFSLKFPMPILYFKDLFLTLIWIIKKRETYDLYIGLNPLNAFAGIILKKVRLVNKAVYYTIDYVPKRYRNKFLNFIYHKLDKFCVYHADETWNVAEAMKLSRENYNHMNRKAYSRQFTLPGGVWLDKFKPLAFGKINKYKLVYIGGLRHIMGVDLIIDAMPELVKKNPKIRLDIIGGGIDKEKLQNKVRQLKIEKYVTFHGWIKERNKILSIASDGAIGIATFNTDEYSIEIKNADPAKVKEYLSMGLPVITTNVLHNHQELKKNKCAIIIPYSVNALIKAVEKLTVDKKLLQDYRTYGRQYISKFSYPILFSNALRRVL